MQVLSSRATALSSASRCRAPRPSVCAARPVFQRNIRLRLVRAAEEATATETETASTSNGSSPDSPPQLLSPIERAREALQADNVDRSALEAALAELDAEIAQAQENVAAAESKAALLESTVATAKDQLLRLNADFDNFRRRSKDEKDSVADSVRGDVVQSLLPLVDNFELARTQVKAETESEQKINNSYQNLYKQMVDIMRGLGIEAVPTIGSLFDPELHEAIMREPNDDLPDGSVVQEFRKGFRLGNKLLRPAMVKVSFSEAAPAATLAAEEDQQQA
ncbi:GrpE nucleotide release factor [Haematococcus lacustris]